MRQATRQPKGRYEALDQTIHPGRDFRPEGAPLPGRVEIAHARLVDPTEMRAAHLIGGKFQRTMVNIARDPLEREYRYHRLTREQHAAGVRYRETLEWARGYGGVKDEGLRSPSSDSNEYRVCRMIDAARAAVALRAEAVQLCGRRGEFILTAVLGDDHNFRETANLIGSEPGAAAFWKKQAGLTRVAREFRDALGRLADEWYRGTAA